MVTKDLRVKGIFVVVVVGCVVVCVVITVRCLSERHDFLLFFGLCCLLVCLISFTDLKKSSCASRDGYLSVDLTIDKINY